MIARFLLLLLVGLVVPRVAFAQGNNVDAARAAEAAARDAFRQKKYALAAEGFEAAFRLDPKANTKYNEALAWDKAERPAAAADAYEAALSFGGLGDKLTTSGNDSLAALKTKLGRLVVNEPLGAKISVAHARERGVPAKVHLAPGEHEVVVILADGSEQQKKFTVVAGSDVVLRFEAVAPEVSPAPQPTKPTIPKAEDNGGSGLTIAGWTLVGLGAAGLIAMGVTGALTLSKVSQYDDTGHTDVKLHDEAVTLKTTTNVLVAAGSGLAAVGVVLLIVANVSDDDGETTFIRPTANGVVLRF